MTRETFKRIKEDDLVKLTQSLVRIPSVNPPGDEQILAELIHSELQSYGFSSRLVEIAPKRANVVASYQGRRAGKTILLNCHMDVVPAGDVSSWKYDPFSATLEEGRIFGRGSVDMKGGLAASVVAARAFIETRGNDFSGKIILTGVIDEEDAGLGTKSLVEDGIRADMAIIAEPTDGMIYRAHKGVLWFEITTRGVSLHSSQVKTGRTVNAIHKMTKVVNALENYLSELEKRKDTLVGNPTISVGMIRGGTKTNVVADSCTITVDRRLLPNENPKQALNEIRKILSDLSKKDKKLQIETRVVLEREGAIVEPNEEIVKVTRDAAREVTGKAPRVTGCIATTDMAFLVNRGKIPTVVYGPGSLEQAHVANEFVEVKELVKAAKVYASVFERILCR